MNSSLLFSGLELCYHAFKDQVKRDSDLVVLFVHWYLVNNGFNCVVDGRTTEILPVDWNNDDEIYVINYSLAGKGYELKCLVAEDSLIINLMKKSTERTANITCKVKDHVTGLNKEYKSLFINLQDLYDNLKKEFQPLFSNGTDVKSINEAEKSTTGPTTQSEPSPYNPDPLRVTRPDRQPVFPDNYGRNDLDPFGRFDPLSRGGMIFDPFRDPNRNRYIPGNLPPGSVPPQARFDPFGPPNPDDLRPGYPGRIGPNPSHLRPPEFDDQFM